MVSVDILRCLVPSWPDLLPGYDYRPAAHVASARPLTVPPPGIMIHSGESAPGTAEWAWNQAAQLYAHFAWSRTLNRYVQTCGMTRRAPHAGTYNGWLGIEMPGPAALDPRPAAQREAVRELVAAIVAAVPSVRRLTGHQFVSITRRDPGPGVTADWWDGLGLEATWRWVGRGLLG